MESLKVADYMNTHPVTLKPTMSVAEAVEKLINTPYLGAPVIADNRQLLGFLSEQDCLAKMIESSYYNQQTAYVRDIMRTDVLTVKPYQSALDLAQQMLGAKPKIYPVTDDNGFLVGAISRTDVLRAVDLHLRDAYRKVG
ncbi:CBS domain-containing protein [Neptunicella marina]|uniref:CBS domain-containing protein n=1 Tax=Neptunicella marina TaxID=2125989 RepID=A0A8J6IWE4_9ALTE|nr:CBS domain-containing protein [Neptunicella marina]MBC3767329.1 CBS domain-containing protein [Neptunicella marina]